MNGRELAIAMAQQAGIDPNMWVRQVQQESGFNPNARSHVGAIGYSQIMPDTWSRPGFGLNFQGDINNPEDNMRAGAQYMRAMLDRYDGNYAKALTAYNWGAGNADKWSGDRSALPDETRGYLRNILDGSDVMTLVDQEAGADNRNSPVTLADDEQQSEEEEAAITFHPGMALSSLGAAIAAGQRGESATKDLEGIRDQYFKRKAYEAEQREKARARQAAVEMVGVNSKYGQALMNGADPNLVMAQYSEEMSRQHSEQMAATGFGYDRTLAQEAHTRNLELDDRRTQSQIDMLYKQDAINDENEALKREQELEDRGTLTAAQQAEVDMQKETLNQTLAAAEQKRANGASVKKAFVDTLNAEGRTSEAAQVAEIEDDMFSTSEGINAIREFYATGNPNKKLDDVLTYEKLSPEQRAVWDKIHGDAPTIGEVNVDTKGESEQSKRINQNLADHLLESFDSGRVAGGELSSYYRLEEALKTPGVTQGAFGALTHKGRKVLDAVGLADSDAVTAGDVVEALSKEMALEARNTESGAGMPGAMSDADREFLMSIVAGLGKSKGANQQIIDAAIADAMRRQAMAEFTTQYAEANGGLLDVQYLTAAQKFADKHNVKYYYDLRQKQREDALVKQPGDQSTMQPTGFNASGDGWTSEQVQ